MTSLHTGATCAGLAGIDINFSKECWIVCINAYSIVHFKICPLHLPVGRLCFPKWSLSQMTLLHFKHSNIVIAYIHAPCVYNSSVGCSSVKVLHQPQNIQYRQNICTSTYKNTPLHKMLGTSSEFEFVTTASQRYNVLLSINDPVSWGMYTFYGLVVGHTYNDCCLFHFMIVLSHTCYLDQTTPCGSVT